MKSNKGMTIVELIIAIAMLAMVMTAIGGLMSSNTLIFKKSKSDAVVQNMAQETYNRLTDAITQAREVRIEGYVLSSAPSFAPNAMGKLTSGVTATDIVAVKTPAEDSDETAFGALKTTDVHGKVSYTDIYVSKLEIVYTVPLEIGGLPPAERTNTDYRDIHGDFRKDLTDVCKATYTFDKNIVNIEYEYALMTEYNTDTSDPDNLIYTKDLNYVVLGDDPESGLPVSAVVAEVDAENSSISLDMSFAEIYRNKQNLDGSYPSTGMNYTSQGMIKIRNSYILEEAK